MRKLLKRVGFFIEQKAREISGSSGLGEALVVTIILFSLLGVVIAGNLLTNSHPLVMVWLFYLLIILAMTIVGIIAYAVTLAFTEWISDNWREAGRRADEFYKKERS